ncbi:hypothetical protein BCR35DRAFT_351810 [Leucosporidium creatinivorum]|uniref:C3H1-type domain-containing protein n=1 Tax=Leucosporidium creatinivorum TaxID=106004 RepID=A0A1Y2FL35_9BASI|nr:hypothetical protein BCR35DRAFT_351810 [Leucosporidium creatinivorum]
MAGTQSTAGAQTAPGLDVQSFEDYVQLQASAAAIVRNACEGRDQLLARIAELESELQVWKVGHREAVKEKELVERTVNAGDPSVLCLLDGDGCLFHRDFVSKGREGGRLAALALNKHIMSAATDLGAPVSTVICHIFYNKQGLSRILQEVGIATEAVFSAFVQGLNAAHPLFVMTDVGPQKEAADAKFRESLRFFSKLPSCKLLLAGCEHDGGYSHLLQSLETEGLADKIRVLKSFDAPAFDIKRLNFKTVKFEGLFETKKLVSYAQQSAAFATPKKPSPSPATPAPATAKKTTQLNAQQTPAAVKVAVGATPGTVKAVKKDGKENTGVAKLRAIDPKKALSKQNPPPCNAWYLKGSCSKGANCTYEHNYRLSPKQLDLLRKDAKKSPCMDALKGKPCSPDCIAGHKCPWGSKCRYGDTCRFKAPGMHPIKSEGAAEWSTEGSDASSTDYSSDE